MGDKDEYSLSKNGPIFSFTLIRIFVFLSSRSLEDGLGENFTGKVPFPSACFSEIEWQTRKQ
jgi:hypothetical protein